MSNIKTTIAAFKWNTSLILEYYLVFSFFEFYSSYLLYHHYFIFLVFGKQYVWQYC
jgi:hypothetical protein